MSDRTPIYARAHPLLSPAEHIRIQRLPAQVERTRAKLARLEAEARQLCMRWLFQEREGNTCG